MTQDTPRTPPTAPGAIGEGDAAELRKRKIAAEACAVEEYLADYVMSVDGPDYIPTEWERELIEDALQGWLCERDELVSKHWTEPSPALPEGVVPVIQADSRSSEIERAWIALADRPCETEGLEDMEAGCCAPCRARHRLAATPDTAKGMAVEALLLIREQAQPHKRAVIANGRLEAIAQMIDATLAALNSQERPQ